MRILLTGRSGQVGWELERALPVLGEVIATDRAALDLGDLDAIRRVVRDVKPQIIVNAAAYTAVDKAESEPDLAHAINATAPGVLAEEAKRLGALLVHYSTDYVFDGTKATPYVEEDAPNPINVYGASKLAGERAVQASGCRHLILRTSWVYGPRGKNFLLAVARKLAAGERLRVVDDQRGVPTSGAFLAQATSAIVARLLPRGAGGTSDGLYHLVPRGETTWCGFAHAIGARLRPDVAIDAIRTADYPTRARRPTYSVLDNRKIVVRYGLELPSWERLLDECVSVYQSMLSG